VDDVQFFGDEVDEPQSEHVVTIRIRANSPSLAARVLDDIEELVSAMTLLFEQTPGVSAEFETPGFVRTFYGHEVDVWKRNTE
jgi:hypothetical protein